MKTKTFLLAASLLLCLSTVQSQIINPKKILEKKANKSIEKTVDKTVDTLFDGQKKSNENVDNAPVTKADEAIKPSTENQPSLQSYSQYDFVPGDSIVLFEDFSQDAIGDFPALWTTNKTGEVNTLNIAPGNWFNLNATEGNWWFLKEINFPKNFIMEFDLVPKKSGGRYAVGIYVYGEDVYKEMSEPNYSKEALLIDVSKSAWEVYGMKKAQRIQGTSNLNPVKEEKVNHVIVWVQNRRVRIYHDGAKVVDVPTILNEDRKFTRLGFVLYRGASCGSYISNIKITTATPDTRSKLLTEGKLVSYGIYFDVNKDVVKPESYGTLKDIAQVLQQNPQVRVKIVGHTDADGDDAANLDLSKRRAISVKNELVKTFAIDASRLETDGMGESKPIAPNDTAPNKALNRRVEFIKL